MPSRAFLLLSLIFVFAATFISPRVIVQAQSTTKTAAAEKEDMDDLSDTSTDGSRFKARRLIDNARKLKKENKSNEALSAAKRALAIYLKVFGPENYEVSVAYDLLGSIYRDLNDYALAEQMYLKDLAISEKAKGPDSLDVAISLSRLASVYKYLGDPSRAEAMQLRALAIREKKLGPEDFVVAISLYSLGSFYVQKGDYARAEPLLLRSMAITEKKCGKDHEYVAFALNQLASIYSARGDYARAEPLLQRALAISEKNDGPNRTGVSSTLFNLAVLYGRQGDDARAEPFLQRAVEIGEKSYGINASLAPLETLLMLLVRKGDIPQAMRYLIRANEIAERSLVNTLRAGSEKQKRVYLATLAGQTNYTVFLTTRFAPDNQEARKLALTSILRRKGRVLDSMTDQIGALRRRLGTQDRTLLDQLSETRAQLSAFSLSGSGDTDRAELTRLETEAERLEAEMSKRNLAFRVESQPINIERVQQSLPSGAALVEIALYRPFDVKARSTKELNFGERHYVAYVLRREGEVSFVDLGEVEPINKNVATLRTALRDQKNASVKEAARALDEQVMRPVRKLVGDSRLLLLSPDGALNLIPFAALVDENNHYLVENYTISYLTSGRDLLRLEAHAESRQKPVVIANPTFDLNAVAASPPQTVAESAVTNPPSDAGADQRSLDFTKFVIKPLPGTAEEASALKTILTDAQVFDRALATEAAVKQVTAPRILHIATHGFFLTDQPAEATGQTRILEQEDAAAPARVSTSDIKNPLLRSGLVLAGVKNRQSGAGEDGVLTALEAAGLDLWGTKLVVLSACETGVGDVKNGDGVYGLRRALVLAGAESELMSLWQVSDQATRDLMIDYYKRLQAGEERGEAIRQAQIDMLKHPETSHPFFWASFIPIGDWRSLENEKPSAK